MASLSPTAYYLTPLWPPTKRNLTDIISTLQFRTESREYFILKSIFHFKVHLPLHAIIYTYLVKSVMLQIFLLSGMVSNLQNKITANQRQREIILNACRQLSFNPLVSIIGVTTQAFVVLLSGNWPK